MLDLHIDSLKKKEILGFDYLINKWKKNKFKTFFLTIELLEEKSNLFLFYFTIFFSFFAKFFLDIYRWGFPWHHQDKEVRIKTVLWFVDATSSFCEICSPGRWSSGYWGMQTCMYIYGVSIFVDYKWCGSLTFFEIPSLFIIPQSKVYCNTF